MWENWRFRENGYKDCAFFNVVHLIRCVFLKNHAAMIIQPICKCYIFRSTKLRLYLPSVLVITSAESRPLWFPCIAFLKLRMYVLSIKHWCFFCWCTQHGPSSWKWYTEIKSIFLSNIEVSIEKFFISKQSCRSFYFCK